MAPLKKITEPTHNSPESSGDSDRPLVATRPQAAVKKGAAKVPRNGIVNVDSSTTSSKPAKKTSGAAMVSASKSATAKTTSNDDSKEPQKQKGKRVADDTDQGDGTPVRSTKKAKEDGKRISSNPAAKKTTTPARVSSPALDDPSDAQTRPSRRHKTNQGTSSFSDSDASDEEQDDDGNYGEETQHSKRKSKSNSQSMALVIANKTTKGTERKRKPPKAGEDWDAIASKYAEISGLKTECKSTLPNRYNRMKTYFVTMNDEDAITLFKAKIEIDKEQADELWQRVADRVEAIGGLAFEPDALFRNWKKLSLAGNPIALKANYLGTESIDGDGGNKGVEDHDDDQHVEDEEMVLG
ncbi:hypothetical protein CAC42_5003 [Sphaceloma murrayae]|uniref:Uncharacterized protein n=1 Tax=Sphaceloma murrayae TaxID=2082308 RepID=A0A2K1QQ06_9PEZI|nr:hypothetical protein CAC42_5003 [Sphaceloma murrayae]